MSDRFILKGIDFAGLLTIAFIVLKLTNHIDWSWWWILAPIWGWCSIVILSIVIVLISFLIKGKEDDNGSN